MERGGVIYDFGMNNGDDVEYYLLKGCKVVGVEANPVLCGQVERRFSGQIAEGRLVVVNAALAVGVPEGTTDFYVHRSDHVLSQLRAPDAEAIHDFERIEAPCREPAGLIRDHGDPQYIKIDLEGLDAEILRAIFKAGIHPPEVSAESHTVDVFTCLVEAGYDSFNLVDGATVSEVYRDAPIETAAGPSKFSFKAHSAGPFGTDLTSEWQDADSFLYTLAAEGLGWKDVHASRSIAPTKPRFRTLIGRQTKALAKRVGAGIAERAAWRK